MDGTVRIDAPFVVRRRIQFAETDMAGVLHFSNYFRLMEEAEHGFWRSINLTVYGDEGARIVSWPRVAVSCEYFKPAKFEDELDLHLRVVNVGRRSAEFECEFFLRGERIAQGRMTCVCCETSNGKFAPIEIPASIRAKLTGSGLNSATPVEQ